MNMSNLDRKKAIPELIGDTDNFLIISGLAGPAKDIGFLTKESPNTFLFGGAMGGAIPTSLGLAISRPKDKVLCVSGDGDTLMSLGSLATIGIMKPKNLIILCKKIKKKYKIKTENFLGHSDIAPLRKIDPGEKFPWRKLSKFKLFSYRLFSITFSIVFIEPAMSFIFIVSKEFLSK